MFPFFAKETTSWEGHLSGAIAGTICAIAFMEYGPQRPDPFADEDDEEKISDEESGKESGEEEQVNEKKADCHPIEEADCHKVEEESAS